MFNQFDMFAEPAVPQPPRQLMSIEEITIGKPAKKQGYIGKFQGRWIHLLLSVPAFALLDELGKEAMRDRLRGHLESPT